MSKSITGIVAWLKNWFYDESEIDGFVTTLNNSINSKLNKNLTEANKNVVTDGSGNVVLENKPVIPDVSGKIDTAGTGLSKSGTTLNHSNSITAQTSTVFKRIKYDAQGHITGTEDVDANDLPSHLHTATQIGDSNAHQNIGTPAYATQGAINTAIDSVIGSLSSIRAIEVVTTLPTASSSTMGKLYIISENSKVNVYYTEQSGSTYTWHKMDTDILDDLVVNWSDVQGRPTKTSDFTNDGADGTNVFVANNDSRLTNARTPTSHTHGNITNDGKIGSESGKLVVTGSAGTVTATTGGSDYVHDANAHSNIGTSASATQTAINTAIDTKIGTLQGGIITSIVLVDKATDSTGKIIFYTGDEPT